jgi:hypothetical protein
VQSDPWAHQLLFIRRLSTTSLDSAYTSNFFLTWSALANAEVVPFLRIPEAVFRAYMIHQEQDGMQIDVCDSSYDDSVGFHKRSVKIVHGLFALAEAEKISTVSRLVRFKFQVALMITRVFMEILCLPRTRDGI